MDNHPFAQSFGLRHPFDEGQTYHQSEDKMAATRKTAKAQRASSAHSVSEGPPPQSSTLQRSYTGPGYPQHHNEERYFAIPRQVTARSAPLGPLLQPENKFSPPIHRTSLPLSQVASTTDPQFFLPPYESMGPPIMSLPAIDKKAFNAPAEQGFTQVPIHVQATSSVAKENRNRNIAILEQRIRATKQQIRAKVEEKGKMEQELEQEEEMRYVEDYQSYLCGVVNTLKEHLERRSIPIPSFAPPPQRRKYSSVDGPQDVEDLALDRGRNPRRRIDTAYV